MNYLPLLKLTIKHNYYQDGYCSDFMIEADTTTHRILKNHRCILKQTHIGFVIYQAVDNNSTPFISISPLTVFRFHLKLVNSQFALFTDLSSYSEKKSPTLTNKNINNDQLILFDSISPKREEDFASIEIQITDSIFPVKNRVTHYHIIFTAKLAHWEYFFITDKEDVTPNYQIKHAQSQISEPIIQPIVFKNETPQAQEIVDLLTQQHPKENLYYFISEHPVPCQQSTRKHIQILRDEVRLLDNIPNPSLNNINQRFFADDNNQSSQETFFHIVKYMTHSLSTTGI
ncbi:MAG: hypothetical protein DRQ62_00335 [Gammaproteobacteria bacterium]|nr:MAG: hypothetical protein DRQ62_00335 [Gammaproteobacteria bacterium]